MLVVGWRLRGELLIFLESNRPWKCLLDHTEHESLNYRLRDFFEVMRSFENHWAKLRRAGSGVLAVLWCWVTLSVYSTLREPELELQRDIEALALYRGKYLSGYYS